MRGGFRTVTRLRGPRCRGGGGHLGVGDAGPVDGHRGGRGGQAALRRGAAEGRHDGLRHLADEALVARGAEEHGARLAAEAAQGPEVHPPDRLRGQRLEPGLDCGGGAAAGGPAEGGDVGQLAGVPGPGCRGPGGGGLLLLRPGTFMSPEVGVEILAAGGGPAQLAAAATPRAGAGGSLVSLENGECYYVRLVR